MFHKRLVSNGKTQMQRFQMKSFSRLSKEEITAPSYGATNPAAENDSNPINKKEENENSENLEGKIHPDWLALERRLQQRKPRTKGSFHSITS